MQKAERWFLACTGAGAQALWYAAMAGPVTFGVALGLLWYGTPTSWVVVVVAGVFVFFAWLAAPATRLDGRVLTADEAPALFETIERNTNELQKTYDDVLAKHKQT